MLKVKCPACKGEMELENEAAGHRVACDCGAVYELPPAPPSGDFRICVNCVRLCEKDALVCPDCSFHFLTGRFPGEGKSSSSGSEEEERGALSFFPCKRAIALQGGAASPARSAGCLHLLQRHRLEDRCLIQCAARQNESGSDFQFHGF